MQWMIYANKLPFVDAYDILVNGHLEQLVEFGGRDGGQRLSVVGADVLGWVAGVVGVLHNEAGVVGHLEPFQATHQLRAGESDEIS